LPAQRARPIRPACPASGSPGGAVVRTDSRHSGALAAIAAAKNECA
jgi:hypothetical protein